MNSKGGGGGYSLMQKKSTVMINGGWDVRGELEFLLICNTTPASLVWSELQPNIKPTRFEYPAEVGLQHGSGRTVGGDF